MPISPSSNRVAVSNGTKTADKQAIFCTAAHFVGVWPIAAEYQEERPDQSETTNPTTIGTLTRTLTKMYHADKGGDLSLGQSFPAEFMATHRTI
jgi:hypothetical protein